MTKPIASRAALAMLPVCMILSACGSEPAEENTTSAADDYAARINGEKSAQATPTALPTAEPLAAAPPANAPAVNPSAEPDTAPAPQFIERGTASDPSTACNAASFSQFLGQQPSTEVRSQIMDAASEIPEVRFIAPGTDYINPDPTHPRLNIMIAVDGVIRDIRCG
ncbi:MAG: hypothetical protein AAFQ13_01465 [Pseudomonadota bacterium]